ncbi:MULTISPECIES: ATP-binding protein [unclassified Corynebacterium]|uniref:ATP-binding protein n=1 Tax=unclassified Corynebacterium TaxID=2624378 RepID=UPI0029CA2C67|nr:MULTISPECIES: ATP-binding protein [unclassified Corynebacterium]WPF66413.1 ATP-binding protein [Corynebacterium sp. 22KM0430]WPF68903.1 ATP-binding protein [Corynebacterium sp. 21KM1197]
MKWTSDDVARVLADMRDWGDDFTLIEAKAAAGGLPENLPETMCAFANMPQGGTVLLGVDQRRNFEVVGVSAPADIIQGLLSQVRNEILPAPPVNTYPLEIEGKTIVVAEVSGLSPRQKPARFRGRAYLRQADGDYVMNPNDLAMIEVERVHEAERVEYDAMPVRGTTSEDLDSALVSEYLASVRRGSRRLREVSDEDILRITAVTTPEGELTVAGLYALGYYPQGQRPALAVTAAVRLPHDGSGIRNQNRQDFDGPLPVLLDDIQQWVMANIGTTDVYRADGGMEHRPDFPLRAVREIVANALVHRDLGPHTVGAGARVQIRILPEKMIVVSPGGLKNLSVDELRSGEFRPRAVNQRLYEMCKHLHTDSGAGVIEGEGGGIREALAETRDADLRRPRFIDRGVDFTVMLRGGSVFSREDERVLHNLAPGIYLSHVQKALLLSLSTGESWSVARMVSEFSPLTRTEADNALALLLQLGLVAVTPQGIRLMREPIFQGARGQSLPRDITKNGPAILAAMPEDKAVTFQELGQGTGLAPGAIRYAINKLIEAGYVVRDGGQGDRSTSYRRIKP